MGKSIKSVDISNLNRRQVSFIRYYLNSTTITEACKKSGIKRQTFYNWKNNDPEFQRALKKIRNVNFQEGFEEIRSALPEVIQELKKIALESEQESLRLGAIKTILKMGLKWNSEKEIGERITRIEEALEI